VCERRIGRKIGEHATHYLPPKNKQQSIKQSNKHTHTYTPPSPLLPHTLPPPLTPSFRYDADGGQTELKPHRDGSVVSFNIALNPSEEFDGGGTYFAGLQDALRIEQVGLVD
jgi:hypothetical protein